LQTANTGDAADRVRRIAARGPSRNKTGRNDYCLADWNSNTRRARSCNSSSVPRTALHRPHRTRVALGEFAGSATLIERLPQSSQTILKRHGSRAAVSSALIVLKLVNTRLRRQGRPCRGPSNGGDSPSVQTRLGAVRALQCGKQKTARRRSVIKGNALSCRVSFSSARTASEGLR
jgi:hypothetical protein